MHTRLRSASNSQERRNSVSDISEIFQSKINSNSISMPPTGRKTSGRSKAEKEKDKEREKSVKEARENIKAYLNKMDDKGNIANGEKASAESAPNSPVRDNDCNHAEENASDNHEDATGDDEQNEEEINDKAIKSHSIHTQTNEDEILKAIKELASKYQSIEDTLNHPHNGLAYQLAKASEKINNLHTDIHGAVSGVLAQMEVTSSKAVNNEKKILQMENAQKRMAVLLEENKRLRDELALMQGLVQKVSQQSNNNMTQLMDLTRRGMEQNIVVHGMDNSLETEDPKANPPMFTFKERCKHAAIQFFKEEMNIDLEMADIWKAHRTGQFKKDKVRPMILKVSYAAKELIFDHISTLKGRSNPKTKQVYFVSEQVPEGVSEIKKQVSARLKPLKEVNDKKPREERDSIYSVGDKILINGEVQEPEVTTPTPAQLFLSATEQESIDKIQGKFVETTPELLRNSEFIALAVKVHSIQEVKNAYIAAYQRYPAADHITMGYALKQDGKLKSGFCDDKEYGAGIKIKDLIFERKMRNAAIFVCRKYGGVHLGFQRFRAIENVGNKAVQLLENFQS